MAARQTVTISPWPSGGFVLRSRYDTDLIAAAKECGGRWKPSERVWHFATVAQARMLQRELEQLGFRVLADFTPPAGVGADSAEVDRLKARVKALEADLRAARAAQARQGHRGGERTVEELLRAFGLPAYRALTRVAHPDAGGNHDWMVAINTAWDKIGRSA